MLKGVLAPLLLQLVDEQEDYGYALVVRLHERGFADLREGTVYPALSRMEASGLLASRLVRSDAGPARKYYRITAAGQEELTRAVAAWNDLAKAVARVLVPEPERSAR
jgi:PadR family transcriptional regulator, regulatory protein PadR